MEVKQKLQINKTIAIALPLIFGLALIIFLTMLIFNVTDYGITIASFGASIFMILSHKSINKKMLYGSYIVGTFVGYLFSTLTTIKSLNVALAAISSILIMTLLDLQHAPAVGISAAIVLNKFSFWVDLLILIYIFFIFTLTWLLKLHITDPNKVLTYLPIAEIKEEKIKWNIREKTTPDYLKLKPY
ncbi:MAG: HPP family protein [Candidatus Woesearchaeota archaeon]